MILAGLALSALTGWISFLSHRFVFGEAHLERPIVGFLVLIFISFLVYFSSSIHVMKSFRQPRKRLLFWILFIGIIARLLYFPSEIIQETDPYRYAWDGQAMLRGENPYRLPPEEAFRRMNQDAKVPEAASYVGTRINHPEIRTVYPPLAQCLFAMAQMISPWSFIGWRVLIFFCELLILFCLCVLLRRINVPREWVILYAWSPLILKEYSNSLHLDVFSIPFFLLSLMLSCSLPRRSREERQSDTGATTQYSLCLAYICLALSALVKGFAVFLLPVLVAFHWRKYRREAITGVGLFLMTMVLFYWPFLSAGSLLFEGLGIFAKEWTVNEGAFGVIRWMAVSDSLARGISMALLLVTLMGVCRWVGTKDDIRSLGQAFLIVLAALFFLAPQANPWYFTWVVPLLVCFPLRALIVFSGLVFLYYLDFFFFYRGRGDELIVVRFVEYGVFFLLLGYDLWVRRRPLH